MLLLLYIESIFLLEKIIVFSTVAARMMVIPIHCHEGILALCTRNLLLST